MPEISVDLSVVIVTYNSAADIRACLESLEAACAGMAHEVLVVDNASRDDTIRVVAECCPRAVVIVNAGNRGFAAANNQGLKLARGRCLLLLNPDTVAGETSMRRMMGFLEGNAAYGLCGPTLVDGAGQVWADLRLPSPGGAALRMFGLGGIFATDEGTVRTQAVSGACMMIRRDAFDDIGLLDEAFHTYEDGDYCKRALRAGYSVAVVRDARVVHLVGRSARSNPGFLVERQILSQYRYFRKHGSASVAAAMRVLLMVHSVVRLLIWKARHFVEPTERARAYVSGLRRSMLALLAGG